MLNLRNITRPTSIEDHNCLFEDVDCSLILKVHSELRFAVHDVLRRVVEHTWECLNPEIYKDA